ncbi:Pycsar system effector family protein [Streptomyces sp. NPDC002817]|uniref:Pycsar system effector family protein n=1 Tax=Streptomyces sp. NPDC088357 TaxID=3154655 RepID=UPI00341C9785
MRTRPTPPRRPLRIRRPRLSARRARVAKDRTTRLDQRLDATITSLEGQLSRCDGKANLLLAFNGAVLLIGGTPTGGKGRLVLALQALSACGLLAAINFVLLAIWARTRPSGHTAWPFWALLHAGQIRDCLADDQRAEDVGALSRLLRTKYRRINASIAFTLAGLALALTASWTKALL